MPYYTHEMVRWMRQQERLAKGHGQEPDKKRKSVSKDNKGQTSGAAKCNQGKSVAGNVPNGGLKDGGRTLRITPSHIDGDAGAVSQFEPPKVQKEMNFDEKRLKYMRNLLRLQVERINRIEATVPASGKDFAKYEFDLREPIRVGERSKVYTAKHRDFASLPMVVKVYEAGSKAVPNNPLFFKYLRHLGKKHPYIVQTWEVFRNEQGQILVVQEFANRQDVVTYLAKHGTQPEQRVCGWAHQMYKALDYLGDMGVCHRGIKPKHILLNHKDLGVRLTGFYDSVVYWDPKKEDISNNPCLPVSSKNRSDVADFQAPEVFGNDDKEEFDPIQADIWSYAAVIYFMLTNGGYPYDWKVDNVAIEDEIRGNVQNLELSEEGKSFVGAALSTNAMTRLTFEKINNQPWFNLLKKDKVVTSQQKVA